MHLTCLGNIALILILVVIAVFIVGVANGIAAHLDDGGHSGLAVLSMVIGITVACMLPIVYFGFRSEVYRLADDGTWEKSEWLFSFRDDDGVRHSVSLGRRYFYAGPEGTPEAKYMRYYVFYSSDPEDIGTKVQRMPQPEVLTLKGGDFVPIGDNVSFIGSPDNEYELETYNSKVTKGLKCFARYHELTAADSTYRRLVTVPMTIPYQD